MKYRYRKEDEMKDSGVEWIKNIPKGWQITKLKMVTKSIGRGKSPEYVENSNVKVINQACVYGGNLNLDNVKYQNENLNYSRAKIYKGDLLINSTGTGTLGRTSVFNEEGEFMADSHITVVSCEDLKYSQYLGYAIRTNLYQGLIYSTMVTGSTNQIELSREGLRNMNILISSEEELTYIIKFLDEKTVQFDSIISKKEALIQKLEEVKKSLISEIVTGKVKVVKTSDGYELIERKKEEIKDSGVEWLGKIPKKWDIKRVKYLATLNPSKSLVRKFINEDIEVSFIAMESVRLGHINTEQSKNINEVIDGYTYFENDDIIMAKVTPCFENKNIAICKNLKNGIGFGSTELNTIRCFSKENTEFLFYNLQEENFMNVAKYEMTGAGGLKRVPSSFILNAQFAYSQNDEKKVIVSYLKKKMVDVDEVINKIKVQIEKIKEAKQSLISEAVTGKIEILD